MVAKKSIPLSWSQKNGNLHKRAQKNPFLFRLVGTLCGFGPTEKSKVSTVSKKKNLRFFATMHGLKKTDFFSEFFHVGTLSGFGPVFRLFLDKTLVVCERYLALLCMWERQGKTDGLKNQSPFFCAES